MGKVLKVAGVIAAIAAVAYWQLYERQKHSTLSDWRGKDWSIACTDPEGRLWGLEIYRYLDSETHTYRWTDKGLRVKDAEGKGLYKTVSFRYRALAKHGVWRWKTPKRGAGILTTGFNRLPVKPEKVEVAEDFSRVVWTLGEGGTEEWTCREDTG